MQETIGELTSVRKHKYCWEKKFKVNNDTLKTQHIERKMTKKQHGKKSEKGKFQSHESKDVQV